MYTASISRPPRWYSIPVRVLLFTFVGTLLSFAFSLLFAILGILSVWAWHGVRPDMTITYRKIALPSAIIGGIVILLLSTITEIRHYRRSKALDTIEKIS